MVTRHSDLDHSGLLIQERLPQPSHLLVDPGGSSEPVPPRVAVTLLSIPRPGASGAGKGRRNGLKSLEPTGGLEPPTC